MRNLPAALGAVAVGIGASACTTSSNNSAPSTTAPTTQASTTTLPTTPVRASSAAAKAMKAALTHGQSQPSLHYVSVSTGQGLTTTIVGDVNQSSGTQTIVVSYQGSRASMVIELVGHEAYFRGAAMAIELLINLSPRQSAAAAAANGSRWCRPTRAVYSNTAAALTVASVMSEIALSSPSQEPDAVTDGTVDPHLRSPAPGPGRASRPGPRHRQAGCDQGPRLAPDHVQRRGTVSAGRPGSPTASSSAGGERPSTSSPLAFAVPLSVILKSTTTTTQPIDRLRPVPTCPRSATMPS